MSVIIDYLRFFNTKLFYLFFRQDQFLSVEELVKHYADFAGSRMTKYGDLLKEEL